MRRDMRPALNQFADYEICYGNAFHVSKMSGYNIKSSGFTISSVNGTVYMSDIPNSDGKTGSIFFFTITSTNTPTVVRNNVGRIDYERGEIILNPVNITSTSKNIGGESIIQISVSPRSNDVIGLQDLYLQLDASSSVLNMVSDEISSGSDISGSTYTVTSSYSNGDLVRI
jgi:hypothetical protein